MTLNYPQQPQPGYPAQPQNPQPGYGAPQYGQGPGYPAPVPQAQFQAPPQQGYMPQPGYGMASTQTAVAPYGQPQYPAQQGYGQPPAPQPEMVRASLADFHDQPATGGGPSLTFTVPGTRYVGQVARNITDADVSPATDMRTGEIAKYTDGRIKYVMKIPLVMQPTAQYPEGIGVWYVKGNDKAELTRAMEAAGVGKDPETGFLHPPKAGDFIDITFTHEQQGRRGMNPTKIKHVVYTQGNGMPPQMAGSPAPGVVMGQVVQDSGQLPQQGYQQPQAQGAYAGQQYQAPQYQPQAQQPPVQYNPSMPGAEASFGAQWPEKPNAPIETAAPASYMQPGVPYAPQPQQQFQPPQAQPGPTGAPPAPQQPGAPSTAGASPSDPNQPPANWPEGTPFIPGLTPAQAQMAATMRHPAAQ